MLVWRVTSCLLCAEFGLMPRRGLDHQNCNGVDTQRSLCEYTHGLERNLSIPLADQRQSEHESGGIWGLVDHPAS